jgi:hypothetical protein
VEVQVIVIGSAPERERLFADWSRGRDQWQLRRDVTRHDYDRISDAPDELVRSGAIVLAGSGPTPEIVWLDEDPWLASEQAMDLWSDPIERLRQLRLHHLRRAWPPERAPQRAEHAGQVLGYLLQVHA